MKRGHLNFIGTALIAATVLTGVVATPSAEGFAITSLSARSLNASGAEETRAGAHPFAAENGVTFSVKPPPGGVDGYVHAIDVALPPGFVGNPQAAAKCPKAQFNAYVTREAECPLASQVGIAEVDQLLVAGGSSFGLSQYEPLYSLEPQPGVPAEFGFIVATVPVRFSAGIGYSDGQYRIVANLDKISQGIATSGSTINLWGEPSDSRHDPERGFLFSGLSCAKANAEFPGACPGNALTGLPRVPFLTNPTSCGPQTVKAVGDSWEEQGTFSSVDFTAPEPTIGCDRLTFKPSLQANATSRTAGAPSGLSVDLHFATNDDPDGLANAHLRNAKVTLPEGMQLSPSSANGLTSCSDDRLGLSAADRLSSATCPVDARIGTVEATTPLLEETLEGGVYLRSQASNDPESGDMFRLALVLESKERGIVIKLPGHARVDRATGRIVASFDENPQFPVEDVRLDLQAGPGAPLTLPATCGPHTVTAELTSWAGQSVVLRSAFEVDAGCGAHSFDPNLLAGSESPAAGHSSPFVLRLTRADGDQNVSRIEATLPQGVLAKLAGVTVCDERGAATGSCPANSRVGRTVVGAGAGERPIYVPEPGKEPTALYLAGPYRGAPYSLIAKVPAQAGPFDLGTVVVRNALRVNPVSAQVTAISDPLPQMLSGVPIAYRDVRVEVDRPDFTINPTNCEPQKTTSRIVSVEGSIATPASYFQVVNCERLAFKPKLALSVKGPTRRAAHPRFKAVLTMPGAGANIARAQVTLPKSEILEQSHIRTICTRVQYAAGQGGGSGCPKASIYGFAKAWSPLLDRPLQGPVYLRSSSHELPDLVAALGGQIQIDLVGRIDAVNARIRNTFEAIPDAPVSRFVLEMQGGKKGLLVNSTGLCGAIQRASAKFDGQNGKVAAFEPAVKADCGKKRKHVKRAD